MGWLGICCKGGVDMRISIVFLLFVSSFRFQVSTCDAQVASTDKQVINRSCRSTTADTVPVTSAVIDAAFKKDKMYRSYSLVFEFDKGNLCPASFRFLDSMAVYLQQNDSLVLRVGVHSDIRGNDK